MTRLPTVSYYDQQAIELGDVLEILFYSAEFSFTLLVGKPKAARAGNGVRNGGFHRDTPDQDYTSGNVIQAFLCLDAMTMENGPTLLIRGSHKVSDEEAQKSCWADVGMDRLKLEDKVAACCPAGSGLFFASKIIHAAGHNRSDYPRRTINIEWAGPGVLTTSPIRFSYQGLRPRSKDPLFKKQIRMTFPKRGQAGQARRRSYQHSHEGRKPSRRRPIALRSCETRDRFRRDN